MDRELLIKNTAQRISLLPDYKLKKVAEYVDSLLEKKKEKELVKEMTRLSSSVKAFDFLEEDEELYGESDIVEKY